MGGSTMILRLADRGSPVVGEVSAFRPRRRDLTCMPVTEWDQRRRHAIGGLLRSHR